jgi:hypothetical protein
MDEKYHCASCPAKFSLNSGNSTLKAHLDKCKPSIEKGWKPKTFTDPTQPSIVDAFVPSLPIEQQKAIDQKLVLWMKVQGKPLLTVEEPEFKSFVKALNPKYAVPSRYFL